MLPSLSLIHPNSLLALCFPTQNLIPDAEEFVSFTGCADAIFCRRFINLLKKAGEENERDQEEVLHLYSEVIQITQSRAPRARVICVAANR